MTVPVSIINDIDIEENEHFIAVLRLFEEERATVNITITDDDCTFMLAIHSYTTKCQQKWCALCGVRYA